MAINKFTPTSPDPNIQQDSDMVTAKFGHLNTLVDNINNVLPSELEERFFKPTVSLKGHINLPGSNIWDDGAIFGNVAVFNTEQGTSTHNFYDITDVDNPILAATVPSGEISGIFLFESYYLFCTNGGTLFKIYDVRDPYNPVVVSSINMGVSVNPNYWYKSGNIVLMMAGNAVYMVDVSDYTTPIYKGQLIGAQSFTVQNMSVTDNHIFLGGNTAYSLYQINWDDLSVSLIDSATGSPYNYFSARASNNYFVVALGWSGKNGFAVFSVINNVFTQISDFVKLPTGHYYSGPGDCIRLIQGYLYLMHAGGAVNLYDINNLKSISLVQTLVLPISNTRHIQSDIDKIVVASRTNDRDIYVLEINNNTVGVIKSGEILSQEAQIENLFVNGLSGWNAKLDNIGSVNLSSSTIKASKKFLYPKYTTAQRTALTAEAGEAVYDTDTNKLYIYDGTTWQAAW